jgi:hypothetical protein
MRIASMSKRQLVVGTLVALLSFSLPTRVLALREESDQLAQLLGEARAEAAELAKDADETESLIRTDVSWQTHADMLNQVKELATNTTNAINYLNQNKNRPPADPYKQYLKDNADTAHQLASTVSSLFEYEKTMAKMGDLKNKLELNGQ